MEMFWRFPGDADLGVLQEGGHGSPGWLRSFRKFLAGRPQRLAGLAGRRRFQQVYWRMFYSFGDHTLDTRLCELRCAGKPVRLEPQVFDVLVYLIENRDRVVLKQELLDKIWNERFVTEATLSSRLMAARKAVGDSGRLQQVIQTVHGRGFRFIAEVEEREGRSSGSALARQATDDHGTTADLLGAVASPAPPGGGGTAVLDPLPPAAASIPQAPQHISTLTAGTITLGTYRVVGRERELATLNALLGLARTGARQVVCITGEPGLGKTTLAQGFLQQARERGPLLIASGQCIEHRGSGEAYLPVLEALVRLCREPGGEQWIALLAQHAPTWLVQMPWLLTQEQLDGLQTRVLGATRDRMLREMAETLDAFAGRRPLLLVLEDLHWSDYSTIDLLQMIARRQDPARLMIIGTYRPADAKTAGHPLHAAVQELRTRGYCHELPLTFLSEDAVTEYLGDRFPGTPLPQDLPRVLHRRTDGNPFFMVTVADHWVTQGLVDESPSGDGPRSNTDQLASAVPETLRQMIEQQFERLSEQDQQVLEAAAVAGFEFSTATVAAAAELKERDVEACCTRLAREGRFLRLLGVAEWPDGTFASRFGFIHSLYEEVLYERIPAGQRVRLHQRVGERLEAGHGVEAREMAAELAIHFVRGRDAVRAIRYSRLAAEHALRRSAHCEALEHINTGLRLLAPMPDSPQRVNLEFSLQSVRGPALIATMGWAAPEVERTYQRAVALSEEVPEQCDTVLARLGLATTYEIRGQYRRAQAALEVGLHSAEKEGRFLMESHELMACTMFHQGQFARAVEHAKSGFLLYDPQQQYSLLASYGDDPGVACKDWEALSLWYLGYPDQALQGVEEAVRLAEDHVYSLANARAQRAYLHQFRREVAATAEWAGAAITLARELGFPFREATGQVLLGWAMAQEGNHAEGITFLQRGMETCCTLGAEIDRPYFLALLAEAYSAAERHEEALSLIAEALSTVRSSRAFFYEGELHRLMASLLLKAGTWNLQQVEASLQVALDIARRQGAKSIELRAAVSLARLWRQQDRHDEARQLLQPIHTAFTEGFETPDLRQASSLLEANGVPTLRAAVAGGL